MFSGGQLKAPETLSAVSTEVQEEGRASPTLESLLYGPAQHSAQNRFPAVPRMILPWHEGGTEKDAV